MKRDYRYSKILITLLIITTTLINTTQAQLAYDALKYSNIYYGGTARFVGIGGAMGAVGADPSTLSTNPAGIGLYRRSEITFSPAIYSTSSTATYQNETNKDSKTAINIGNVAGIAVFNCEPQSTVKNWQLGVSLNRLNNFNNREFIQGYNSQSSLVWGNVENMNRYTNPNEQMTSQDALFWDSYVINRDFDANGDPISGYYNDISSTYFANGNKLLQNKITYSKGGVEELTFSGGANISDRVYIGLTLGLPFLNYTEESSYSEYDDGNGSNYFQSFTLNNYFRSSGVGVNGKLGVIVQATNFMRVGAAVHTPTLYNNIRETYTSSIESIFDLPVDDKGNTRFTIQNPYGYYNWSLTTPWRVSGSLAFFINKLGLISIDYEYADYASMSMSPKPDFQKENSTIKNSYGSQHIVRVGTEWNVGPMQLRAGYGYYGSPYKNKINDLTRMNISGGLGFRTKYFFMDLAYQYTFYKMDNYLYGQSVSWETGKIAPAEFAKTKSANNIITLTLGVKI